MKAFRIVFPYLISTLLSTLFLSAQDKGTWEITRPVTNDNRNHIVAKLKSTNEPTAVLTLKSYTEHVNSPKSEDIQMLRVYFDDEGEDIKVTDDYWGHGIKLRFVFDDEEEKPMLGLWRLDSNGDIGWMQSVGQLLPPLLRSKSLGNFNKAEFLDKLWKSNWLTISYRLTNGVIKYAKFDLSGTNDIIKPLFAKGRWFSNPLTDEPWVHDYFQY